MSPPPPGNDANGEETPKGPRRSRRRLLCVQSSQCGSGGGSEPRVVWDCQSPDQILATTATTGAAATAKPGRRLSPGKLTDQLDPADSAKSCAQPETPPLVRIWLRERKTAATALSDNGAEEPKQEERDARMRSPLRSLNGPARKLRRAIATAVSAVDRSKAAPAAAAGCSASMSSSAADSAADAELFGKLAAVVCAQRRDVSVPTSSSPSMSPRKYPVNDSPDSSLVIPLIEDMPGWSDQSGFGEASFSAAVAESGSSPVLRAAAPSPPTVSRCTMRVRLLQTPSLPAAMDVDCSPRASTPAGKCRIAAVRAAVDRDAVAAGASHDGSSSRSKIIGTSMAATKMAFSRTVFAADAAVAASPRVPVSAHHAGPRKSPRLLAVGGSSDQRSQLRALNDLGPPASIVVGQAAARAVCATASADAAVLSASGGVRRQLCLLTASSGSAPQSAGASEASTAASSAVPRVPTVPSASAIGCVAPKQTTYASTALPRPSTVSASVDAHMSCQVATTLPPHVQGLPRGVQSRPAVAPAKLVNLWDSRHRSNIVLGKSATSSATVAELQASTVAGGQHGAGISVGVGNAGSQSNGGTGARCSSEEIARKKQEALERRMRKAAAAVVTAIAPTKGNEKETTCSLHSAGVETAMPAMAALVSVTVQAVGTGCFPTSDVMGSVAAAGASATAGTVGTSTTSVDAASTGSSSQGQMRCSSEEIARKRQLALERKMKKAAASTMQQSGSAAPIRRNGLTDVPVVAKGP